MKFLDDGLTDTRSIRQTGRSGKRVVGHVAVESTKETVKSSMHYRYPSFCEANQDFNNFSVMVKAHIGSKIEMMTELKCSCSASRGDRNYASIQLLMLHQYQQRLTKFELLCKASIENLCDLIQTDEELIDALMESHLTTLVKMKRRMKQMMDISEKYAVVECLIDGVKEIQSLCEEMDPETESGGIKLSSSMLEVDKAASEEVAKWKLRSLSESVDSGATAASKNKKRTFKSVADHLIVITKSFTHKS